MWRNIVYITFGSIYHSKEESCRFAFLNALCSTTPAAAGVAVRVGPLAQGFLQLEFGH